MRKFEQWQDMVARLYPDLIIRDSDDDKTLLSKTVTFQVTDECNLKCS